MRNLIRATEPGMPGIAFFAAPRGGPAEPPAAATAMWPLSVLADPGEDDH
jgi:hypothetical protein